MRNAYISIAKLIEAEQNPEYYKTKSNPENKENQQSTNIIRSMLVPEERIYQYDGNFPLAIVNLRAYDI